MQISLNLAEIEALPKCIRNKSSEILNFFSAEIPSLVLADLQTEAGMRGQAEALDHARLESDTMVYTRGKLDNHRALLNRSNFS